MHPYLIGGGGTTHINDRQNVWLAYTPAPGLENNFTVDARQHNTYFTGAGVEKLFPQKVLGSDGSLGLEFNYLSSSSFRGVVHPMVNVAPDFDVLNYAYDMNSYSLYLTGKLSKQILFPNFGLYVQGGIGGALNSLRNYTEVPPTTSSAAPMLAPFNDGSTGNFTYLIGAGVAYQLQNAQFSLGYRYVFSGSAGFDPAPIQQTGNTLNFSPFAHQFIVLSLMI